MEVTSAYLYTANTLPQILEAIQKAQVPPKFTNPFLQALGFKSTNDRAFINVWKGLGFLDGSSTPTEHYKAFRDKAIAKGVLARQIRLAYKGLFGVDENAQNMSFEVCKVTRARSGDPAIAGIGFLPYDQHQSPSHPRCRRL